MNKFIGCTKDGALIYDRPKSHLDAHPIEQQLLEEAFEMIDTTGKDFIIQEINFGRIIGNSYRVKTDEKDEIIFAQRKGRNERSRFVKNRLPEKCQTMVVILKRSGTESFILITAYIGIKGYGEPWDTSVFSQEEDYYVAQEKSTAFWRTHALIYDQQIIVPGTECTSVWWL